jgi:Protein of unknown function (DUF3096)
LTRSLVLYALGTGFMFLDSDTLLKHCLKAEAIMLSYMLDPALLLAVETVQVSFRLNGVLALLAGVLILLIPRLLNLIVAIYLILVGLVEVFGLRL